MRPVFFGQAANPFQSCSQAIQHEIRYLLEMLNFELRLIEHDTMLVTRVIQQNHAASQHNLGNLHEM